MRDELLELCSHFRDLWDDDSAQFRDAFLDELERIRFRLAHPPAATASPSGNHRLSFYCMKCDAIAQGSGMALACPVCSGYDWLKAVTYRVDKDG